jgi:predicted alternative tryptophan synthase beta-subunit
MIQVSNTMKKIIVSAAFVLATAGLSLSAQVGQDLKSAGKNVKDASATGAHKTDTATKKAYHATTKGVKKGAHKTASETQKGAGKVANKTSSTSTSTPK